MIQERLQEDLKTAMKAGDDIARGTLRMALAALKNLRIEVREDLSEEQELRVLAQEVKKRQDAAEQYDQAERADLAEIERAEIVVIQRYLPEGLSEDEVREVVRGTIESLELTSKKDLGQVMKAIMAEHKGRVDGKLVQRFAAELLD